MNNTTQTPTGRRFIFIGGAARSGTTLVQNILDCHPDICGGPVFTHVQHIVRLRNKLRQSIDHGHIHPFCGRADVDRLCGELLEGLLLPLADRYDCALLSEKTTANILVFPELMEMLPAARFIRVVRDPRAVVSSILQVGQRARRTGVSAPAFTRSLSAAVAHTRERFHAGERARAFAPHRLHTVVYESLVRHPERETRKLCSAFGLAWHPEMLHPGRKHHPGESIVADSIWYESQEAYYRDPEPSGVDKWKKQLSAVAKARMAVAFGRERMLEDFGYDISCTTMDRLLESLSTLSHGIRRIGERLLGRQAIDGVDN